MDGFNDRLLLGSKCVEGIQNFRPNRLTEIRKLRGCEAHLFYKNPMWLNGPDYLRLPESSRGRGQETIFSGDSNKIVLITIA